MARLLTEELTITLDPFSNLSTGREIGALGHEPAWNCEVSYLKIFRYVIGSSICSYR
jgi:hypothetical protein